MFFTYQINGGVKFNIYPSLLQKAESFKSELDKKMQTMCRKRKAIDTKPLEEPMKQWDILTVQEKHDIAAAMIDVVLISDETGIEVKFSI